MYRLCKVPNFSGSLGPDGPMLDVLVSSVGSPTPFRGKALIDTGASHTFVDRKLAEDQGYLRAFVPQGFRVSTAGGVMDDPRRYYCRLEILGKENYVYLKDMGSFVSQDPPLPGVLEPHVILIGRDLLDKGKLVYDGLNGTFSLDLP